MNNLITSSASMTSKEIAELVESRHDSVKRAIERLAEQEVIAHPPTVDGIKAANGVVGKVYTFLGEQGKRDSIVVVAQLSPAFTARLVDRWQELEHQLEHQTSPALESRVSSLEKALQTFLEAQTAQLPAKPSRTAKALPAPQVEYLDPAEIAVRLGLLYGGQLPADHIVNTKLVDLGYQRIVYNICYPTEKAVGLYKKTRGKNPKIQWNWTFVKELLTP